ncbi:MAG: transposase, partial [Actinobacteria bacterium]|nr:transposase [Actinomycetota bacterium]
KDGVSMPRSRPPYPEQFRREAVALVRSAPERSVPQIARELGISGQTLRNWVRQTEVDRGARHGLSSDGREELRRLRREVSVLAEEREILKKVSLAAAAAASAG